MYYRLVFTNNSKTKYSLKILLLICGILCDIAALFGLILASLGSLIYLLLLFISLAFSILFRVIALRLVYNVECSLNSGNLVISKIFPHKSKVVFCEKLGKFEISVVNEEKFDLKNNNYIDLRTQNEEQYLICGQNIGVLCNLDRYIYACALKDEEI